MGVAAAGSLNAKSGYFPNGLPFNRFGHGPARLVLFQGMQFENRPLSGLPLSFLRNLYKPLEDDYTLYLTTRRPGLPDGYSLRDMSDDYGVMIREEFGGPVDIIGLSTGGLIAQHFAGDHPDLVRRLVIHSSAHRLSDAARELQVRVGDLVGENRWREAYAALFEFMSPRRGMMRHLAKAAVRLASPFGGLLLGRPVDPSDMLVTYEASNGHDFKGRLAEIKARTLVLGGDEDPFYTTISFRETAEGIPDAKLILYKGVGHPASGKRFTKDLLSFLQEGTKEDP